MNNKAALISVRKEKEEQKFAALLKNSEKV